MKKPSIKFALSILALGLLVPGARAAATDGLTEGKPDIKSMTQLAFGPDGVLFIADPKGAAIIALDTGDTKPAAAGATVKIEGINQKIAAKLGTAPDQILIGDLAVNPISRQTYLTVSRGLGPDAVPVLVRVTAKGDIETVSLEKVKFARAELANAPADAPAPAGTRRTNPRLEAITDIAFVDGRVLVAGLSNEEFSSSLRALPYPFKDAVKPTSVEMYHGAHGGFETRAPVRTFTTYAVNKETQLLAAYTCTPLVQIPINDLKPGTKVKGKTIAEFGNGNRPLDIIVYQKDGKDYLLLANATRGVMKIAAAQISGAAPIEERVADTKGLAFDKVDWTGVSQLDRFDDKQAVVVRTGAEGALNLEALPLP